MALYTLSLSSSISYHYGKKVLSLFSLSHSALISRKEKEERMKRWKGRKKEGKASSGRAEEWALESLFISP